ncbi:F-box/LRR-repeat protein At4g14103-like isoform X2 [Alnus glutinosa]|uniref:F-box/LRR-repeat protein At4g14103-like isoform X2 n=1 Tax=Alnus glutinosa TaxID=3517 RepID=UPI002D77400D|nr:F-box/LRR-repeat protein At4g14103-like isoform X2 [Alnus glutinosa]
METTCVIQKPQKKQKLNEEDDIDGNRKCLGNLPEEILRHIISFLPTKGAVKTSVLCKRWEYLWTSIPNLDFDLLRLSPAERKRKRTLFMNFVDRVLCLRDSPVLKRFTVRFDVLSDASRVNAWISDVIRHNVEELYIQLVKFKGESSLPHCLFTFLEKLELYGCSWGDLKVVGIYLPKLHSLSIREFEESYGDDCMVIILGNSLKEFYYKGLMFSKYGFYEPVKMKMAHIDIKANRKSDQITHNRYKKLLTQFSNVESLRISSEILKYATKVPPHMPLYNNLVELVFFYSSVDLDCEAVLNLLQGSPCLQNLEFWGGIRLSSNCEQDDWIFDSVPSCFLSHLNRIKVGRYHGSKEELSAVKILLKNSVVLKEMVITCKEYFAMYVEEQDHFTWNLEKQENQYKQLIELSRGSKNCKIVFL